MESDKSFFNTLNQIMIDIDDESYIILKCNNVTQYFGFVIKNKGYPCDGRWCQGLKISSMKGNVFDYCDGFGTIKIDWTESIINNKKIEYLKFILKK